TTYNVDARYAGAGMSSTDSVPVALLPHYAAYDATPGAGGAATGSFFFNNGSLQRVLNQNVGGLNNISLGGMDESWDAADLQNMFLAMVPPRAAELAAAGSPLPIIPSFHRPELVQYLTGVGLPPSYSPIDTTNPAHRDYLRTFIM